MPTNGGAYHLSRSSWTNQATRGTWSATIEAAFVPDPGDYYDPYFTQTDPDRLSYWNHGKLRNVHLADVSCDHCNYKPQRGVLDPKAAFRQHLRLRHPELKHRAKLYIIHEEDEIIFH